ncbi:MAG: tautomerase family protein [Mycobacteriaceae bacterium]
MPLYQCSARVGLVESHVREEIAQEFTRIHVSVTGAPAEFVNVVFLEQEPGTVFTAGAESETSIITGFVRQGRGKELRQQLLTELSAAWCRITGQAAHQVLLGLLEVDPTSTMEAGLIMPAPGEESEWFVQHSDYLKGLKDM